MARNRRKHALTVSFFIVYIINGAYLKFFSRARPEQYYPHLQFLTMGSPVWSETKTGAKGYPRALEENPSTSSGRAHKSKMGVMFVKVVLAIVHIHIFAQQNTYCVNTVAFHLIDRQRKEFYTNDQAHPWRELMVRVWYPTDSINNNKISDKQRHYPLLVFSHGLGGQFNGDSYESLCKACVQAGYVVVTLSHSYACKPIQFPDGRITTHSWLKIAPWYQSDREMNTWEADVAYVLNQCQLYACDEHSFLYDKLDLDIIGMFGHSYGGAVAIQMCRKDHRIKAAINLDGPLRGNNATALCGKPLLFIVAAPLPYSPALMRDAVIANDIGWSYCMYSKEISVINACAQAMNSDVYKVVINAIRHTTFSDEIFSQHTVLDDSLIDPFLAHTIISSYIIAFFDTYLKGLISPLLDCNKKIYQEVEMHCWK